MSLKYNDEEPAEKKIDFITAIFLKYSLLTTMVLIFILATIPPATLISFVYMIFFALITIVYLFTGEESAKIIKDWPYWNCLMRCIWPILMTYSLVICLSIYVLKFKSLNETIDTKTESNSKGVKLHHVGLVPIWPFVPIFAAALLVSVSYLLIRIKSRGK